MSWLELWVVWKAAHIGFTLCGKEVEKHCVGKFGQNNPQKLQCVTSSRNITTESHLLVAQAHELADDEEALELARTFHSKGKIVGAICIAPMDSRKSRFACWKKGYDLDSKGGKAKKHSFFIMKARQSLFQTFPWWWTFLLWLETGRMLLTNLAECLPWCDFVRDKINCLYFLLSNVCLVWSWLF